MVKLSARSEGVDPGEVVLRMVPTDVQLADALTQHTLAVTLQKALISGGYTFH